MAAIFLNQLSLNIVTSQTNVFTEECDDWDFSSIVNPIRFHANLKPSLFNTLNVTVYVSHDSVSVIMKVRDLKRLFSS